jgi:hypothetical protein
MLVEALVPELAVEGFDVVVLHRLAGLGELQPDAVALHSRVDRLARELRPLISANRRQQAVKLDSMHQHLHHLFARDAVIDHDVDRLISAVIDDVQAFQATAIG